MYAGYGFRSTDFEKNAYNVNNPQAKRSILKSSTLYSPKTTETLTSLPLKQQPQRLRRNPSTSPLTP